MPARKRKESQSAPQKSKSYNKNIICQNARADLKQLEELIMQVQRQSRPVGEIDEIQKRAIIRLACNLGGRLCFIRDSQEEIGPIEEETLKGIRDFVYYRNEFTHEEIYKDEAEKNNLFSKLLSFQSYPSGNINLIKIKTLLENLEKRSDIKELKNSLINYEKKENQETEEANKNQKVDKISEIIKCLAVVKKESSTLNSLEARYGSGNNIVTLAIDNCIGNMLQAYVDYKRLLGIPTSGGTKQLKKDLESSARKDMSGESLALLVTAFDTRKALAHLVESAIPDATRVAFLRYSKEFINYFAEILKTATTKADGTHQIAPETPAANLQRDNLLGVTNALTNMVEPSQNLNNTVNVNMLSQFKQPENSEEDTVKAEETQKMKSSQVLPDTDGKKSLKTTSD
jgi:hypothetical protein